MRQLLVVQALRCVRFDQRLVDQALRRILSPDRKKQHSCWSLEEKEERYFKNEENISGTAQCRLDVQKANKRFLTL